MSNLIKRAPTLDEGQFERLLTYIDENSTLPERDRLIVGLSFKAGLRVAEIAKLDLSALLDPDNRIDKVIKISALVGKKKRYREIPMHPMIKDAFAKFRKRFPNAPCIAISSQPFRYVLTGDVKKSIDASSARRMSVTALTNYYWRLLKDAGFERCSSHSGRRTFGTSLARKANMHHCSIRDVQRLMGHARLETTEAYIELSEDTFDLVAAI